MARRNVSMPEARIPRLTDTHPEMQRAVAEDEVALHYAPFSRMYLMYSVEPGSRPSENWTAEGQAFVDGWTIYSCPWSGRRLPRDVGDVWEMVAVEQYGTEWGCTLEQADRLPPAMLSENWWLAAAKEVWWRKRAEVYGPMDVPVDNMPADRQVPRREPYEPFVDPTRPGISRSVERPLHFCWHLEARFRGPRTMYAYLPQTREYGIRILDLDAVIDHQPVRIRPVPYCPWCGRRHPKPLRQEWEKRLAALGLTPGSPDIPADLRSDTWWREAGL